jgi:hypothetical protein
MSNSLPALSDFYFKFIVCSTASGIGAGTYHSIKNKNPRYIMDGIMTGLYFGIGAPLTIPMTVAILTNDFIKINFTK